MGQISILNELVPLVQEYAAKYGMDWNDAIEDIKKRLLSEGDQTNSDNNHTESFNNSIIAPNKDIDNKYCFNINTCEVTRESID